MFLQLAVQSNVLSPDLNMCLTFSSPNACKGPAGNHHRFPVQRAERSSASTSPRMAVHRSSDYHTAALKSGSSPRRKARPITGRQLRYRRRLPILPVSRRDGRSLGVSGVSGMVA